MAWEGQSPTWQTAHKHSLENPPSRGGITEFSDTIVGKCFGVLRPGPDRNYLDLLSIKMVLPLLGHSLGSFLHEQNSLSKLLKIKCFFLVISQMLLAAFSLGGMNNIRNITNLCVLFFQSFYKAPGKHLNGGQYFWGSIGFQECTPEQRNVRVQTFND